MSDDNPTKRDDPTDNPGEEPTASPADDPDSITNGTEPDPDLAQG